MRRIVSCPLKINGHVTGRSESMNLVTLPPDLFASMTWLRNIYLQKHRQLNQLPHFNALQRLQMLFVGDTGITQLPSFDHTTQLKTLALVKNRQLTHLPELGPISQSIRSIYSITTAFFCSGFLTQGVCNSTESPCFTYDPVYTDNACYPSENDTAEDPSLVIGSSRFPLISDT